MTTNLELQGNLWQAIRAALRESYCSHPDASTSTCSGKIINAHTVSKGSGLSRIAENGHVVQLRPDPWDQEELAGFPAQSVGIAKATTFTGFCGKHDDQTFAPLEKQAFVASQEQCLLLGYRAVCLEYYHKRVMLKAFRRFEEVYAKHLPRDHRVWKALPIQLLGAQKGLQDFGFYKSQYERALATGRFDKHRAMVFFTQGVPSILAAGGPTVEGDFQGNRLQHLARKDRLEVTTFSIVTTDAGGAVVFQWHEDSDDVSMKLMRSLLSLSPSRRADAIVRFAVETTSNIAVSPTWWASLPDTVRTELSSRAASGTEWFAGRNLEGLLDNKVHYGAFTISRMLKHRLGHL